MHAVSLDKLRASGPVLAVALLISLVMFAIVGYLHFAERVPAYQLIDDPAPYLGVEWYTGLLSHLGVLLWCASAAVCGFAGYVLLDNGGARRHELSRLLLLFAVANLWLALDDLLLIHEQLARQLFGFESRHAGEGLILAVFAGLMALVFWTFRATIGRTEYLLLIAAILSLGASVAIDVGFQLEMDGNNPFREAVFSVSSGPHVNYIAEEILKLNGAMLWFAYVWRTAIAGVRWGMVGSG
jgi:hypothetical protein